MPTLRERVADFFFADIFERQAGVLQGEVAALEKKLAATISVKVDDSPGWDPLTPGPADRPWSERADDLDDGLEAWRKNFFIRRLVNLTRGYVIGGGISISSKRSDVDKFVKAFWGDRRNRMVTRLGPMCDELTRAGEIFPVLFTNRVDGMSYIRFPATARQIREIETAKKDYEVERRLGQEQRMDTQLRWWMGSGHGSAFRPRSDTNYLRPLMLHYTVNKPLGATRGEGDLGPVLPWAKRYTGWLSDRVRLNRRRTRQQMLDVEVPSDVVEEKKREYQTSNPLDHGVFVHDPSVKVNAHRLNIDADDAKEDGRALRLAIATGGNVGLHYLGEGEGVNYASAREMGEPTARFYTDRQDEVCRMLVDLVEMAWWRRQAALLGFKAVMLGREDLELVTNVTEVAREDNQALATAAKGIAEAMAVAAAHGWIDDETAVKLILKFAGEALSEDEIAQILSRAREIVRGAESEE